MDYSIAGTYNSNILKQLSQTIIKDGHKRKMFCYMNLELETLPTINK